jgi:hypothetical protein
VLLGQQFLIVCFVGSLVFFVACAGRFVSRLTRESLCQSRQSNQSACPDLGPPLRFGSARFGAASGAGKTDHPWSVFAFRGSRPLNPLRSACTRPSLTGRVEQDQQPDQDHKPDQNQKLEASASIPANGGAKKNGAISRSVFI